MTESILLRIKKCCNRRASAKVVIPVKTGIQKAHNQFKRLDSHLRGNDKKLFSRLLQRLRKQHIEIMHGDREPCRLAPDHRKLYGRGSVEARKSLSRYAPRDGLGQTHGLYGAGHVVDPENGGALGRAEGRDHGRGQVALVDFQVQELAE